MIAGMMLLAAASGQVIAAPKGVSAGDTLVVRRLEHSVGPPGRAPFYRWAEIGRVRVAMVRPDGMAEVAVVRGTLAPGDRVTRQ